MLQMAATWHNSLTFITHCPNGIEPDGVMRNFFLIVYNNHFKTQ